MPRPRKPPRLTFREDPDGGQWVIRDGSKYVRTGCAREDVARAEGQLGEYLAEKHEPTNSLDPRSIPVADILNFYATNHIPTLANPKNEALIMTPLIPFWGTLNLNDVAKANGHRYAQRRYEQGVKPGTVRRELALLRSAVNMYAEDREIPFACRLRLPPPGESRLRWLTRDEAAAFIHVARRRGNHHIARMILIGIYTGTRSTAIRSMRWVPSIESGYFDLESGIMYRKGAAERTTTKRRPSVRVPGRLLPHLKRWRQLDGACTFAIHLDGKPLKSTKKAWANSRDVAGLDKSVIPHTLRHTAASWGIQNVATTQELQSLAEFLGMSLKMLLDVYGHLNPLHQKAASDAISRRPGAR